LSTVIRSDTFYLSGKVCYFRNKQDTTTIEVVNTSDGTILLDNIGYYDALSGVVTLSNFTGTLITGNYIKVTAIPSNPAVINPLRNNILLYDGAASVARAVVTDTI
jgi:hypothetical protein